MLNENAILPAIGTTLTPEWAICGLAVVLIFWAPRHLPTRYAHWIVAACLLFAVARAVGTGGYFFEARFLDFPGPMRWLGVQGIAVMVAAAFASRSERIREGVRPWLAAMLWCIAMGSISFPPARAAIAPVQLQRASWRQSVCIQTHPASCGPAAAATFLRQHGIDVDERQMARACLTSQGGTEPLALLSAVEYVARTANYNVEVCSRQPRHWGTLAEVPILALVRFDKSIAPPGRGEEHVVMIRGRDKHGRWRVADPAFGWTRWSDETLCDRFTGDAIYLARSESTRGN